MDTKVLKKIGLNDQEIKIYLAFLKTGNTTASKISKETNIDRATCYRYLDSLEKKALISDSIENNVKYFRATDPKKILDDLNQTKSEYKDLLPDLIKISNSPNIETKAQVYHGKEGIKTVLRTILREKENHLVLGDDGHFQDIFPIFFHQFLLSCKQLKLKEKVLCSKAVFKKVKEHDYKYSETRALSNEDFFQSTTVIYENKTAIFDWSEPTVVVITNKNIANAYQDYFNVLWKTAKK